MTTTVPPTPGEAAAPPVPEGPPSSPASSLAPPPFTSPSPGGLVHTLLDAALQAQRNGSFDEAVREHPLATRWMLRHHLRALRGSAGDGWPGSTLAPGAALLLRWLVTQLRPDGEPAFDGVDDEERWLRLAGWRPFLATAAHAGWLPVPDFPRHYRRRAGEAALDNLCGLWGVGPSTVYRMLERARHAMAAVLADTRPDALRRLSLRRFVAAELQQHAGPRRDDAAARCNWHARQVPLTQAARDPASELWHRWQADDASGFVQALRRHATTVAAEPEVDAMVERVSAVDLPARLRVDLWLARAALARTRNLAERERRCYDEARRIAVAADDALLLGIVHSAMGKYFEARDADRAFACYQDSAEFLRGLALHDSDALTLEHAVTTFARLAWLYLLRNDSRSKAELDRAEALRSRCRIPDEQLGMLEQVWAEYWRRAGDPAASLEHRHRALNIFERLSDERSVLVTHLNLVLDHGQRGDYAKALACAQKIFDAARSGVIEPALLVSTHLNLGAVHFQRGDVDAALSQYQAALDDSLRAGMRLHAFRARYNLAEAHYVRARDTGDADDEAAGDRHVAAALAAPESDSSPSAIESIRNLKNEVLGARRNAEPDRLLPGDTAAYFDELLEVQRQRHVLAGPVERPAAARAHLAIAAAYAGIAAKERELARDIVEREGLEAAFRTAFLALQQTFDRGLSREQRLAADWRTAAGDLLDDDRCAALAAQLLREGSVNKSRYAELGHVAPATASKHLALLAARGLLVQRGKGPTTRYELPDPPVAGRTPGMGTGTGTDTGRDSAAGTPTGTDDSALDSALNRQDGIR